MNQVINQIIGGTTSQALGNNALVATEPSVIGGIFNVSGLLNTAYRNILLDKSSPAVVSNSATAGVVTFTPTTVATNTDYSFHLSQVVVGNIAPNTTPVYIQYNTNGVVAPTATTICNGVRAAILAQTGLDVVLTGTSTCIITGTTLNPMISAYQANMNGASTLVQTTTGIEPNGTFAAVTNIGFAPGNNNVQRGTAVTPIPNSVVIGTAINGHTYSFVSFATQITSDSGNGVTTKTCLYNVWVDEGDSAYAVWIANYNAFTQGLALVGDDTYAASGITTEDTGAATLLTIASYVAGTFYPGQWVSVTGLVISGATPTNYYNGIWQVLECPSTTTILLGVPFLTSSVYSSGGTVQPLAPINR